MLSDRQLAHAALDSGWVSFEELKEMAQYCRSNNCTLSRALLKHGLDEEQLTFLQACALGMPYANPGQIRIGGPAKNAMAPSLQRKYFAVTLRVEPAINRDRLYVAMLPESARELAAALGERLRLDIVPVAASASAIERALQVLFGTFPPPPLDATSAAELDLDSPASPQNADANWGANYRQQSLAYPHSEPQVAGMVVTSIAE